MNEPVTAWDIVESMVLAQPAGRDLRVAKVDLPDPGMAGMRRALGIPKGTLRHFRRPVRGVSCMHVREYGDHYEVHWDRHDPRRRPFAHWWGDIRGGKVSLPATLLAAAGVTLLLLL